MTKATPSLTSLNKPFLTMLILGLLSACGVEEQSLNKEAHQEASFGLRIANANSEPQNWLATGRDYGEQRFSPLHQITTANVSSLGLAWYHEFDTDRGQQATPLVIDGVLYVSTAWNKVFAFDAASGSLLWQYDPQVDAQEAYRYCCDVINRGVAAWEDSIFVGTLDGRLIALDAKTGEQLWSTMTVPANSYGSITGAPRVVKGMVLIGNSGADFGERGYISAYSAETGELIWRFYTVPGDPSKPAENPALELAASTWTGEYWKHGGGGTVWDAMAYDPEADLLYIGVGNGSPHSHSIRSPDGGDNLFLSSIVALRPDTAEYVWHYQTTPADNWDFTATQPMILADLEILGQSRKVIMQAPKNGFFYVLDRLTGELLSAQPFVETRWASHIDMATGRPVEDPFYRQNPALNMPSYFGGHNWQPMAYSPQTGYAYFPWHEVDFPNVGDLVVEGGSTHKRPEQSQSSVQVEKSARDLQATGGLLAWDVAEGKPAWRIVQPWAINGGALATAGGLVFQGRSDGMFAAYDASKGETLWSWQADNGFLAGPISYAVDGEQYIAVLAGYGGAAGLAYGYASPARPKLPGRLYVFKLGGQSQAPPQTWPTKIKLDLSNISLPDDTTQGEQLFNIHCIRCHGIQAIGGILPDLRYSPYILQSSSFAAVVTDGALSACGMPSFDKLLDNQQVEAMREYLLREAANVGDQTTTTRGSHHQ